MSIHVLIIFFGYLNNLLSNIKKVNKMRIHAYCKIDIKKKKITNNKII